MRRGFTLMELSIVMAVAAIVVPAGWMLVRSQEASHHTALAKASAARQMRTLSEELRRDLQSMKPLPGESLALDGACGSVSYVVESGAILRTGDAACGPPRAVASHVASMQRRGQDVTVTFEHRVGRAQPERTQFSLALPVAAPALVGEVTP